MAVTGNIYNGNTFYVDSVSAAGTLSSFINEKDILLEAIFIAAGTNGAVEICDLKYSNGAYSAGDKKLHVHCLAHDSKFKYLDGNPIRFPNGLWVSVVDADVTATLVLKRKG